MTNTPDNSIFTGMAYLGEGFKLIFKPGMKKYIIIPFIINIILFSLLFFVAEHYLGMFNQWMDSHLPSWLHWLHIIVEMLFVTAYFIVAIYTFVTVSNLVCLPFNSYLSEQVQLHLTGTVPAPRSTWDFVIDTPRLISRQLALMGYFIIRAALILILFFIPVIQVGAGLIWLIFNAWMMTIQHIDYPMDNNLISFDELQGYLNKKRWTALGFGLTILFLSIIPIINFFVVPAAVAGATLFWVKECSEQA